MNVYTENTPNLKSGEKDGGGPAPGVHRDQVAGGDGVQLHGRQAADSHAGGPQGDEQEVEQPRAARLAAVVENIDENRWENI